MEKLINDVNEFEIRGRIVHIFHRDNYLQVTLSAASHENHRDYPRIVMYGEEADAAFERLQRNDFVSAKGRVWHSRQNRTQSLIANSIKPALLDVFDSDSNSRQRQQNLVKLRGEFIQVFCPDSSNGNTALITVRTVVDNRVNYLSVTAFGRMAERAKSFKRGDRVAFIGSIQTHHIEKDGETVYYQDIVGAILPDAA